MLMEGMESQRGQIPRGLGKQGANDLRLRQGSAGGSGHRRRVLPRSRGMILWRTYPAVPWWVWNMRAVVASTPVRIRAIHLMVVGGTGWTKLPPLT